MRMLVRKLSSCIFFNLCGLARWLRGFAAQSREQKQPEHEIQADHQFDPGNTEKGRALCLLRKIRGQYTYFLSLRVAGK